MWQQDCSRVTTGHIDHVSLHQRQPCKALIVVLCKLVTLQLQGFVQCLVLLRSCQLWPNVLQRTMLQLSFAWTT